MGHDAIEILKKALSLPPDERAEIAGSLIESLDETQDESVQAAWEKEIVRRMGDFDTGKGKPVSIEEFRKKLSSAVE